MSILPVLNDGCDERVAMSNNHETKAESTGFAFPSIQDRLEMSSSEADFSEGNFSSPFSFLNAFSSMLTKGLSSLGNVLLTSKSPEQNCPASQQSLESSSTEENLLENSQAQASLQFDDSDETTKFLGIKHLKFLVEHESQPDLPKDTLDAFFELALQLFNSNSKQGDSEKLEDNLYEIVGFLYKLITNRKTEYINLKVNSFLRHACVSNNDKMVLVLCNNIFHTLKFDENAFKVGLEAIKCLYYTTDKETSRSEAFECVGRFLEVYPLLSQPIRSESIKTSLEMIVTESLRDQPNFIIFYFLGMLTHHRTGISRDFYFLPMSPTPQLFSIKEMGKNAPEIFTALDNLMNKSANYQNEAREIKTKFQTLLEYNSNPETVKLFKSQNS